MKRMSTTSIQYRIHQFMTTLRGSKTSGEIHEQMGESGYTFTLLQTQSAISSLVKLGAVKMSPWKGKGFLYTALEWPSRIKTFTPENKPDNKYYLAVDEGSPCLLIKADNIYEALKKREITSGDEVWEIRVISKKKVRTQTILTLENKED